MDRPAKSQIEFELNEPLERETFFAKLNSVFQKLNINSEKFETPMDTSDDCERRIETFTIQVPTDSVDLFIEYLNVPENKFEMGCKNIRVSEEMASSETATTRLKLKRVASESSQLSESYTVLDHDSNTSLLNDFDSAVHAIPYRTSSVVNSEIADPFSEFNDVHYELRTTKPGNDMYESSASSVGTVVSLNEDNRVEFFSNKPIADENDLDVVMMFLENERRSGGGDVISHSLDPSRRHLLVTYRYSKSKKEVLRRETLKYSDYSLIANEPFDKKKFNIDLTVIVLKGIPKTIDNELLNMYVENMINLDNTASISIESISWSNLVQNVVYVRINKNYDEKQLMTRIYRRPKLAKYNVQFVKAFETKIIVVRPPPTSEDVREQIELYFSNSKRCGAQKSYNSIQLREPFMFIVYDDQQDCLNILSREHIVCGHKLQLDYLYNFDLFTSSDIFSPPSTSETPKEQQKEIEPKSELENKETKQEEENLDNTISEDSANNETENQSTSSPSSSSSSASPSNNQDETQNVNPIVENELKYEPPHLIITTHQVHLLKVLKMFPNVSVEFLNELQKHDTIYEQTGELSDSMKLIYSGSLPKTEDEYEKLKSSWNSRIIEFVMQFFGNFATQTIQIELDNNNLMWPLDVIKHDPSKCMMSMKNFDDERNRFLDIIGYKSEVERLASQIEDEMKKKRIETEIIDDKLACGNLPRIRILLVEKYSKRIKDKFPNVECKVDPNKMCVNYRGSRNQVNQAKAIAQTLLNSIIHLTLPADKLVIRFFRNKEALIVDWIRRKEDLKCVIDAILEKSELHVYSIDASQARRLIDMVKREFEPLLEIDSTLVEVISESGRLEFNEMLKTSKDCEFEVTRKNEIRVCAFKQQRDQIYAKFLEYLTSQNQLISSH